MRDFGRASVLEPEAIGEPGKRTFRLRVRSAGDTASLWLEKEQLAALGLAIRQILEQAGEDRPATEPDPPPPSDSFPDKTDVDFKIGRLGIGYDEPQQLVVLFAYKQSEDEGASPEFSCRASIAQCRALADRAEELFNAGRPICPLCEGPIDPDGHLCPRRNGHEKQRISLE